MKRQLRIIRVCPKVYIFRKTVHTKGKFHSQGEKVKKLLDSRLVCLHQLKIDGSTPSD